jgi:hypothetical protein
MSFFGITQIKDPFGFVSYSTPTGELRTIQPVKLIGASFIGNTIDSNFWITGSFLNSTASQANGLQTLTTVSANSSCSIQSDNGAMFVFGQSLRYRSDLALSDTGSNSVNITRRWGAFSTNDGCFFELTGSNFNAVTRVNKVDSRVSASAFNNSVTIPAFVSASLYEIYYDQGNVFFAYNSTLLHTYSITVFGWTSTMTLPARSEITNGSNVGTGVSGSIFSLGKSIARLGLVSSQPDYYHIASAGTFVLKRSDGILHRITINSPTSCTITFYDNTTNSGNVIAVVTSTAGSSPLPFYMEYNVTFYTGLTIVTSATIDITVAYE